MNARTIAVIGLLAALSTAAYGQDAPPPAAEPPAVTPEGRRDPGVDIASIVDSVAAATGRKFIIDPRVRNNVQLGDMAVEDVTYPMLLSILRAHGWFAHEVDDLTLLLPSAIARTVPLRVLQRDDPSVPDHEYVTRVLTVRGMSAAVDEEGLPVARAGPFVPVLRPLVGQEGHLAGFGDKLVIVDRYDNVRRITAIVEELDR